MAEVALEQVSKVYPGGIRAVSDLGLRIRDQELLVLVGPSGCGKTTTLRLLAGLEKPTQGMIRLGGIIVNSWSPRRREVAMVFQRPAIYPGRSVRENLAVSQTLRQGGWFHGLLLGLVWPGGHRRWKKQTAETELRVRQAAQLLDLELVLDRRAEQLSGGQQQRVALGRTLVRRPQLILLDEPLGNLDAALRLDLRHQLHLLHRQFPATMVYVTHDPAEALSLGDRIAVLNGGRLQQVDVPWMLLERPMNRFVAGFVGWPPMSFLEGYLCQVGDGLAVRLEVGSAERWQVPLPGLKGVSGGLDRRVILGIRPQQVRWHREAQPTSIPMQIARVELLGSQTLVTLAGFGQKLAGLSGPANWLPFEEGQKVMVSIDARPAYLFDPDTGLALPAEPTTG
jgi:ABC-type sugar transport system ATPase subunit